MEFLIVIVAIWMVMGVIGAVITQNRSGGALVGGCLGFFLGPIGIAMCFLVPHPPQAPVVYVNAQGQPAAPPPPAAPSQAEIDAERARRRAAAARQKQYEDEAREAEARAAAEEARRRRDAERRRAQRRLRQAELLEKYAFSNWPDWLQPIVIGLALAAVALGVVALGIKLLSWR